MGKRKANHIDDVSGSDSDSSGAEQMAVARRRQQPAAPSGQQHDTEVSAFRNKEKVLILSSRGITVRSRHLMMDLSQLIPHNKRDAKLDTKNNRGVINEVADMKGCSSVLFFETRKKKDLYLWLAKAPTGPCIKFHVANVHTMAELKLSGNHLKGSRPVLSFDKNFDQQPHWQLCKEMLAHIFTTPKGHPKSKPFFDHVISFHIVDGRVWIRNYQVVAPLEKKRVEVDKVSLVEVGPRACLNPIVILGGSFGGPVLYENPSYVSPNALRAMAKAQAGSKYASKVAGRAARKAHVAANPLPRNELGDVFHADD